MKQLQVVTEYEERMKQNQQLAKDVLGFVETWNDLDDQTADLIASLPPFDDCIEMLQEIYQSDLSDEQSESWKKARVCLGLLIINLSKKKTFGI
jgi:hypothetical protein